MATVTITRVSTLPDSAAKSDFHALIDNSTAAITNIVNADIKSDALIVDTKLSTISTAGKVNITALTILSGAAGMILFFSGTAFTPLSVGAAGLTLTVNSGATAPYWA